jgi:fascin 1/2
VQPSPVRPVFNIYFSFLLLVSTQFGNVTCDAEEKDNGARFEIIVPESAAGKWAFRHPERGYFLGASADKLVCSAKTPTENELW